MKKTIKEEMEEHYLKATLINDNALLIYTENENDNNKVDVKLRFVTNGTIKENFLTTTTKKEFIIYENMICINEEKSAIAIYKLEGETLKLNRLYSLETHTFATDDFIDIEYRQLFKNKVKTLKAIKK